MIKPVIGLCVFLAMVCQARADSLCNDSVDAAAGTRLRWNTDVVKMDQIVQEVLTDCPTITEAQQKRMKKRSRDASLDIWIYQWTVPSFFKQQCASVCVSVDISSEKAALQDKLQYQFLTSARILRRLYVRNSISLDRFEGAKAKLARYYNRAAETVALMSDFAEECHSPLS